MAGHSQRLRQPGATAPLPLSCRVAAENLHVKVRSAAVHAVCESGERMDGRVKHPGRRRQHGALWKARLQREGFLAKPAAVVKSAQLVLSARHAEAMCGTAVHFEAVAVAS